MLTREDTIHRKDLSEVYALIALNRDLTFISDFLSRHSKFSQGRN